MINSEFNLSRVNRMLQPDSGPLPLGGWPESGTLGLTQTEH